MKTHSVIFLILLLNHASCLNFSVIERFANGVSNKVKGYYKKVKCTLTECCDKPYIKHDFVGLEHDLKEKLFGQPLVQQTILTALKSHILLENPSKALVLSFHGPTGTGKSFVTKIIADNLYSNGLNSRFVHYFVGSRDFPHNKHVVLYKEFIKQMLEHKMRKCENSLFIFDEIDKVPLNLLDVIRSYIDVDPFHVGYNPRKSIFLLLSNSASKTINQITFDYHSLNVPRHEFNLTMFRQSIEDYLFNYKPADEKGIWHSTLISNHLIDHYVPFLPLEREHIQGCIRVELKKYKSSHKILSDDDAIDRIQGQITYEPVDEPVYAKNGCKRIAHLVRKMIIENDLQSSAEQEQQPPKTEL